MLFEVPLSEEQRCSSVHLEMSSAFLGTKRSPCFHACAAILTLLSLGWGVRSVLTSCSDVVMPACSRTETDCISMSRVDGMAQGSGLVQVEEVKKGKITVSLVAPSKTSYRARNIIAGFRFFVTCNS